MKFEVLAFDAYGTLFDVFSVTSLCEELLPGRGHRLASLWRAKQLQYSLLRSLMGRYRDFWQITEDALTYALRSLEADVADDQKARLMHAYLHLAPFADVHPGLEVLKARGMRLVILSNGAPAMLTSAATHAGIGSFLEGIFSADDVRSFKPDPRVYRIVCERLGVSERAVGFVSSNAWDVAGARSAGLAAFWIQREPGEPAEELGFDPTGRVGSLPELQDLLT